MRHERSSLDREAAGGKGGARQRSVLVALVVWSVGTTLLVTFGEALSGPAVLWPSVLAVVLAFVTREIYSSLFLGALAGAMQLAGGGIFDAAVGGWTSLFVDHLLGALSSRWNLSVLTFTLLMGGFVEILRVNGGMAGLVQLVLGPTATRRRAETSVFGLGFLVFFDGLANSMLVGRTMRPVADRAGVSRERLAFLVDSTSSPIASVALVSTWIVTEMSLVREGLVHAASAPETSAYGLLLASLPYRFYSFFLLVIVVATIVMQRDVGPMTRTRAVSVPSELETDGAKTGTSSWLAIVPLMVLIGGVFGGLFVSGGGLERDLSLASAIDALGAAPADLVFVVACATAILVAIGLSWAARARRTQDHAEGAGEVEALLRGLEKTFLPALILVLAWTLNSVLVELGTARYLVDTAQGVFPGPLLPAVVFLTAAAVSFGTGTSWGTMAIVLPLAVPLALELGGAEGALLPASIAAVLAGAVFGDHCSPISDTTLVSAISSGCEPMAHVRTQLPYALLAAGAAVLLGYGPVAFGAPVWLVLLLGGAVCCWTVALFGRWSVRKV